MTPPVWVGAASRAALAVRLGSPDLPPVGAASRAARIEVGAASRATLLPVRVGSLDSQAIVYHEERALRLAARPGQHPRRGECFMSTTPPPIDPTVPPAEKVKQFPTTPGVYLMKDAQGRVLYVGKAKNLRARASSYFLKTAAGDRRIRDWIGEVADIDFLPAESEVDALLVEARLVKDIQPKYNRDLKDD